MKCPVCKKPVGGNSADGSVPIHFNNTNKKRPCSGSGQSAWGTTPHK